MVHSLYVKKVKVIGTYCYEQEFKKGINFITGRNSLGKTSLIKTIRYGLGGKDQKFVREIADNCDLVYLEFYINNEVLTTVREIKKSGARIKVFAKKIDDITPIDSNYKFFDPTNSFPKFLMEKLRLEEIKYFKSGRPQPDAKPIRLSFNDLFRYFYIRQRDGYSGILYKQTERPRMKAFEQILGLEALDLNELELEEQDILNEREKLNNEKAYLLALYQEIGIEPDLNIEKEFEELDFKIRELKQKRETLRQESYIEMVDKSQDKSKYVQLQDQFKKVRDEISDLQNEVEDLEGSIKDIKGAVKIKMMNLDQFDRLEQSKLIISDIPVTNCPVCFQQITNEMKKREKNSQCILCNRKLQKFEEKDFTQEKEKIQNEIKEFKLILENRKNKLKGILNKIEFSQENERRILDEMELLSRFYIPPLDSFEDIIEQIGQYQVKKDDLLYLKKIDKKFKTIHEKIEIYNDTLEKIKEKKKKAGEQDELGIRKTKQLIEFMDYFLTRSGYLDYENVTLNRKYVPFINKKDYLRSSDSQRVRTIIAYYYALLRYSIESESNHIKFLMIDSPKQHDLNYEDYISIIDTLTELEEYSKKFQLIVTSVEVPDSVKNLVIRHFKDNEYLAQPC